jgi:hypothetical protein
MNKDEIKNQLSLLKTFTGDANELNILLTNYKSLLEEKLKELNFIKVSTKWMENACQAGIDGTNLYLDITTGYKWTTDNLYLAIKPYLNKELNINNRKEISIEIAEERNIFNVEEIYQYLKDSINDTPYKKQGANYNMKIRILFDNQGDWPDNTGYRNHLEG